VNRVFRLAGLLWCVACGRGGDAEPRQGLEMPVAINSESPFQYPADLFDQGVEGEVRLRLYVDPQGRAVPESTRVASSSGTPGFDSAAVRGTGGLRFAPARRDGKPIGMAFYLPVVFRRYAAPSGSPTP
jgi:TonB family protein